MKKTSVEYGNFIDNLGNHRRSGNEKVMLP